MATKKLQIVGSIVSQSDYSQTDSTKPDYIKNKLGDLVATESIEELINIPSLPLAEDAGGIYDTYFEHQFTSPTVGDIVQIEIKLPSSENSIIFNNVEVLKDDEDQPLIVVNTNQTNIYTAIEEGLVKIDDTLPAFFLGLFDNEIDLISWEDYTGASIVISKTEVINDYIKLPNEALTFDSVPTQNSKNLITSGDIYEALQFSGGNYIEIDGNTINSTLGKSETATKKEVMYEYNNMTYSTDDSFDLFYVYYTNRDANKSFEIGDTITVDFVRFGEVESITLTSTVFKLYDIYPCFIVNSTQTDPNEIMKGNLDKIDPNLPAFMVLDNTFVIVIYANENYNGANMTISKDSMVKTYVKLPNEALSFDETPTEGSKNLVNSGVLYNILGDVQSIVNSINSLVGGAS